MSSPKTTGKTGPGFIRNKPFIDSKPTSIPAVLAQSPGGAFERHRGTALLLRRPDLPDAAAAAAAENVGIDRVFSQPWGGLLRQCPGGHEASILLSECSFGLGEAGDFHFETLVDAGIRVVIAPFFGPALVSEAVRCNVLLAPLPLPVIESLGASLTREPEAELQIDLKAQQIALADGKTIPFQTHPWLRTRLLHGMDDLDEQLRHRDSAQKFRSQDRHRSPWLYRSDDGNNSA